MANNINIGKQNSRCFPTSGSRRRQMERCVLCWSMTNIPKNTPISCRKYYVQGQGQLCENCYYELFKQGVFSGEDNVNS